MRALRNKLVVALVLTSALVRAQENPGSVAAVASTEQQQASLGNERRTLFGDAFRGRFDFRVDGSYQAEYDDNVFSSSSFRVSDWTNHFSGRLSATWQRKHLTFEAHYAPEYRKYNTYSLRDGLSQLFATTLDYAYSAGTQIRFYGNANDASTASLPSFNFVSQGGVPVPVFFPGALQGNARVLSSNGTIALTHRLNARNSWDASIQGGTSFYSKAPGVITPNGQDSFTAGATLGWTFSPSPRQSFSIEAAHRYFAFTTPSEHQQYDYVKARVTRRLASRWALKLGAGPSFRNDQRGLTTSYALDGSLTHDWQRFAAGLSYDRGSGLSAIRGALTSQTATAFVSYRRSQKWTATASFGHSLTEQVTNRSLNTQSYSAAIQGSYFLTKALSANVRYSYMHQDSDLASFFGNTFHRNLIGFGISYTLSPAVRY